MFSRKKIVITGASGFLGSHLVERLKDDERYEVFALSSKPDDLKKKLGGENVKYYFKDAVRNEYAPTILKDAVIVSCAYPRSSIGTDIADGLEYVQKVVWSAVDNGAEAIINISSQSVYSQQRAEIATEETPLSLEGPYAVGKYAVELMLESICRERKTAYTSLRMASLIGEGFDQRIVNRFVRQALAGETLHVVNNGQRFGFLDVIDAVRAILALIHIDFALWKPVYTVGNAEQYSIEDIIHCIKTVFDEEGLPFPDICNDCGDKSGSTGVAYQLIQGDTGFEPEVSLKESVRRILRQMQTSSK